MRRVLAGPGWFSRLGVAGMAWRGELRQCEGVAGQAWQARAGRVAVWYGVAGKVRYGKARQGRVGWGRLGEARRVAVGLGWAGNSNKRLNTND